MSIMPIKSKKKSKEKKISRLKKYFFISLAFLLFVILFLLAYFLWESSTKYTASTSDTREESAYTTKQLLEDLAQIKIVKEKVEKPKIIVSKTKKKLISKPLPKKKYKAEDKEKQGNRAIKKLRLKSGDSKRPKLVILIDDVSSATQIKRIKALGMKITPSIFPPSELSMTSHKLAYGVKDYMIHLPMESGSKQFNKQYKTLITNFSKKKINARAKELRKLFPNGRYVNNHTGSVFTDNYKAMRMLYVALRDEGFIFVDSRTIASSKVRKIAHEFADTYVARDVFIDNVHKVPYIHKQLRKAVKIARKKGYAIAIGHPHKVTMKALKSAKHIFKNVELVYIDALFK